MKKSFWFSIALIAITFILTFFVYAELPDRMASHWNIRGEADGYSGKIFGSFFAPILSLVMLILFWLLPKIDPKKENYEKFSKSFGWFIAGFTAFFSYLQFLILSWNLGAGFNFGQAIIPALSVLFFIIGIMVSKAKPNWFVGIRTPWTLSNPIVWEKTHLLGGKLFKAFALIILLGILNPVIGFWIVILGASGIGLFLLVFSFLEFRKQKK